MCYYVHMVTIILPGYSSHNKKWLEETATNIPGDGEIRPIYWGHWTDESIKFEPRVKANLLDSVSGKRVVDIVAKSLGTLVAAYLIQKSPEKIRKVILCGIPLNDLTEEDKEVLKNALRNVSPANIIYFQNDEDPHGGVEALKTFLTGLGSVSKVIEKQRSDHEYFYQKEFSEFLLG